MAKRKDIKIGQKFGKLTIIREVNPYIDGKGKKKRRFLVCCECGVQKEVNLGALLNGTTKTCGNKQCSLSATHGLSRSQIYKIWQNIVARCDVVKKCGAWYKYGAKGIRVCEEWKGTEGFLRFYEWSLNNGYKREKMSNGRNRYTIDRIDGTKGYSPDNCRWVDYEAQNCNLSMLSTNKSGYKGVSWSKEQKKWLCVISIHNHSVRIGAYNTQKEAVEARNNFIDKHKLPHQKNVYKGELSSGY